MGLNLADRKKILKLRDTPEFRMRVDGTRVRIKKGGTTFVVKCFDYHSKRKSLDITIGFNGRAKTAGYITTNISLAPDQEVEQALKSVVSHVKFVKCSTCKKNLALNPLVKKDKFFMQPIFGSLGVCFDCVSKESGAELEVEYQQAEKRKLAQDAKEYVKGSRYYVVAWIHPKSGGNDYSLTFYFKTRPSKTAIMALIKKRRSAILEDYSINKIKVPKID